MMSDVCLIIRNVLARQAEPTVKDIMRMTGMKEADIVKSLEPFGLIKYAYIHTIVMIDTCVVITSYSITLV